MARWFSNSQLAGACVLAIALVAPGCRMMSQNENCAGVTQFQQGQYQTALASFQHAVKTDPLNPDATYNLAAAYHQMARQSKDQNSWLYAEQMYNRCLDLNEDHVECRRGLAVLLVETNRSDKAFTMMRNWASTRPQSAEARVELARLYEEFGDPQTAATYLSQALQTPTNDPAAQARALAALGRLREKSGDTAQALENYRRAYQLNPSAPGVAERLASLGRTAAPAAVVPTAPAAPGTRIVAPPAKAPRY